MYQVMVLLSAVLLIGVDQLTKWLAIQHLQQAPVVLIEGVLELRYSENTGIAWGMLPDRRWLVTAVTGVMLLFVLGVLLSGRFRGSRLFTIGATIVTAGGIGNLIDRLVYPDGHVVDFLYVKLIDFPIFNFADCCVVIGAILILAYFFFFYTDKEPPLRQAAMEATDGAAADPGEPGGGEA